MDKKTKKKYLMDTIAIIFTMSVLWVVLIFVMANIGVMTSNATLRVVIYGMGILVGIFASTSSVAVLIHLKENQQSIYQSSN